MITPTAEQCERAIDEAIAEVRAKFAQALEDDRDGGNVFVVLGKTFRVDQARQLLTDVHDDPGAWTQHQGRRTLSVARRVDRGTLSLFVGSNRFVTAETVFLAFADIVTGKKLRNWANIPGVLNLFAVEGLLFPEQDIAIRVTAARLLETGDETDLHAVLPPLHTGWDPLHDLLAPETEAEYRLRPSECLNQQSWPDYLMRLLGEVLPDTTGKPSTTGTADDAWRLFRTHTPKLEQYVRDHLFARLARAIADADDHHVLLHPPADR